MNGPSISRKPIGRKPVRPSAGPVSVPQRGPANPAPLVTSATPLPPVAVGPQAPQLTPVNPSQHSQWQYFSPTPVPSPGQLRRTITTGSVQPLSSDISRRTSLASSVTPISPLTAVTTPERFEPVPGVPGAAVKTCVSCKQAISQNVSIYTCLVCSTAHKSAYVCVWCYTTGAAAAAHSHDASFFVTDSDLRIQGPTAGIPPHLWTVRKNASGRLWYEHVPTGYRTYVQPLTGVVSDGLPVGWQELKTPDNKVYYLHGATGNSSWTKPGNTLPAGWRTVKTPDGVPFYVHDGLRLSTWDRPGEMPRAKAPAGPLVPSSTPEADPKPGSKVVKSSKGSISASDIATAASVATNVAKLSAASDLSPSGIFTATVAAAKLTGLGVKMAGKKMGKLGKGKRLSSAASLVGAAARLTGDDDGGDVEEVDEIEEVEEAEGVEQTAYTTETTTMYTETDPAQSSSYSQQEPYGASQQQFAPEQQSYSYAEQYSEQQYQYPPSAAEPAPQFAQTQAVPEQPTYFSTPGLSDTPVQPPQQEFYTTQSPLNTEQTSYYFPERAAGPYPPPTMEPPALIPPPQESTVQQQQPPVVINSVNITVEETVANQVNVENTEITQNNTHVTQKSQDTSYYYTDIAQPPTISPPSETQPPIYPAQVETPQYPAQRPYTTTVPAQPPPQPPPPVDAPPVQYPDTSMKAGYLPPAQPGGDVPPFFFEPILAGPMMVSPPAEQGGVVFTPTYV